MSTFQDLGLKPELIQALTKLGFETPTPIQAQAIPQLLSSKQDILASAQTGTGKTAAFSLPILHNITPSQNEVQALILSPTRELCLQIVKDIQSFASFLPAINVAAVYGGARIDTQIREVKKAHIVVATPGRINDIIRRKKIDLSTIRWVVLDEADEMLTMGFKEDLDAILSETPKEKQTLLFSATMPQEILRIAHKYMHNIQEITVGKKNVSTENVSHEYYMVHEKDRFEALRRIIDTLPEIYGIVFCRTRQDTKHIADQLMQAHYKADAIHGDLSQAERDQVMAKFRKKKIQVLIATDVAARGIDVNDLTHVINYQLPEKLESYIHRSGRTGRAGKSGISITIVNFREARYVRDVERSVGKSFTQKQVPTGQDVSKAKLVQLIQEIKNTEIHTADIEPFLPLLYQELESFTKEELIQKIVSMQANHILEHYKQSENLTSAATPSYERSSSRGGREPGMTEFSINIGTEMGLREKSEILAMLNHYSRTRIPVGKIKIMNRVTYIDVGSDFEKEMLHAFDGATFDGIPITIKLEGQSQEENVRKSANRSRGGNFGGERSRRSSGRGGSRGNFRGGKGRGKKF